MSQYEPTTGSEAVVATLRAKLGIARSSAEHGRTKQQRTDEAAAAARYAQQLRALGEVV